MSKIAQKIKGKIGFVVLCITLMLVSGCGSPKLEPLMKSDTILAFGDSLTVGYGVSKEHSYPVVLAELSGINVVGSGVSGETSKEGLARLPGEIERTNPDLLILIEGANDILRGYDLTETKKNLEAMIQVALDKDIPVVLIGIPKRKLLSNTAPLYKELAEKYDLVFDSSLIGSLERSPSLKSDLIHFNEKGYRKMAEEIYVLLKENGA